MQSRRVKVLLIATSLQISNAIQASVQAGARKEVSGLDSVITTRYVFGYDLEMMDTVGPAILGLVVFFFTLEATF